MSDATTPDPPPAQPPAGPRPEAERQEELLRQLTDLARSVERLASGASRAPGPAVVAGRRTPVDPDVETRRRVEFAYQFLGEVLGRRGAPVLGVRRAGVRREGGGLVFTELHGGNAARIRAANGATDLVDGLVEGTLAPIAIPDEQHIDSIVVLESRDGVPVALGPCLDPLPVIP